MFTRTRYQNGSMRVKSRESGLRVWEFRCYEPLPDGTGRALRAVTVGYPSDEPLWRVRAGLPDIGMDENWISGLPEPSYAAAVHRAV